MHNFFLLTKKSNEFATEKLEEWWNFAGHIWAKFGRYVVTYNETEEGTDAFGQIYPEWWLRNSYVGFTTWTKEGPIVGPAKPDAFLVLGTGWSLVLVAGVVVLMCLVARAGHKSGVRSGKRAAMEKLGYAAAEP